MSRVGVWAALIGVIVGVGWVSHYIHSRRDIPFDAEVWRSAVKDIRNEFHVRGRMSKDLIRRVRQERWDFHKTVAELGPDNYGRQLSGELLETYYMEPKPLKYSIVRLNFWVPTPWYVFVHFDQAGKHVDIGYRPD